MATKRQILIEKYRPTLTEMAQNGEEGDMNVLFDKLLYAARGGEEPCYVPEGFDFEAFLKDFEGQE